jgi:hypothetical protein
MIGICFTDTETLELINNKKISFCKPVILSENQKVKYLETESGKRFFVSNNGVLQHPPEPMYVSAQGFYLKEPYYIEETGLITYKYAENQTSRKWLNRAQMPVKHARFKVVITGFSIRLVGDDLFMEYSAQLFKIK